MPQVMERIFPSIDPRNGRKKELKKALIGYFARSNYPEYRVSALGCNATDYWQFKGKPAADDRGNPVPSTGDYAGKTLMFADNPLI